MKNLRRVATLALFAALVLVAGTVFGAKDYYLDSVRKAELKAGLTVNNAQSVTVADNAVGASAAVATLTPTSSFVLLTCSDADGCTITLSETGAVAGQLLTVVNISANAATFADTSGVSETAGAFAAGQYDSISYRYIADRWVESARSNN